MLKNNRGTIHGFGVNDADYNVVEQIYLGMVGGVKKQQTVWQCPFYLVWKSMIQRCYDPKSLVKHSTYEGCSVCDEWRSFSCFKKWMEQQLWEGNCLDKDILFPKNKVYSPENCVFVSRELNGLVSFRRRTQFLLGAKPNKNKWQARSSHSGKVHHIGLFHSEEDAHLAWLKVEVGLFTEAMVSQSDARVKGGLSRWIELLGSHLSSKTPFIPEW